MDHQDSPQQVELYRTLLDFSVEAMFIFQDGVVVDLNQTAIDMFGYSKNELIGEDVVKLIIHDEFIPKITQKWASQTEATCYVKGDSKDGTELTLKMRTKIIKGNKDFRVVTIKDITERKDIENKLERQRDHFLKLNEELIISRRKAEESEKMKTAFFSNMSHEIRTPMNGILGFSKLLLDPDLSDNDRIEYSNVIISSGKRLLHIVNDVLDISKLESDTVKIVKTDFNLNELMNHQYSLFSQNEKVVKGKVQLHLSKPFPDNRCLMHTDYNRLHQILTNLLSNALKFTEKGDIRFGYRTNRKSLEFYVEDSGIGVPDDMKEIVFEPFRQVEGHLVKQHGGTGLGLSISRKLTHLLGGKLEMESEEGKGTAFIFSLPYEKPKAEIPSKKTDTHRSLKSNTSEITLLIAEDDDVNFMFYRSFLGNRLKLLRATTGKEAIEMIKQHSEIDIILMDIKMPEMNGFEAIKQIKQDLPDLPIIAQTAYAMPEDKREVLAAGADDYISKPINRRELLQKIEKFCLA